MIYSPDSSVCGCPGMGMFDEMVGFAVQNLKIVV